MNKTPSKGLNIGLWVAQGLLALAFGMAGASKATTPIDDQAKNMPWVTDVPLALVRFIGTAEFAAALGMILPSALRIKPILTPLAGAGLVVIMSLAAMFHISRGEAPVAPVNLVLGGMAAFVAWGRYKLSPIAPRA